MNGSIMAIATVIDADRVIPVRRLEAKGEEIIARWIAEEKDWVARCIELGFKTHNARPENGSSIEYEVIYMEDGSIRIEGRQAIATGNDDNCRKRDEDMRGKVLEAICKGGCVTIEELKGSRRCRNIVFCRFIVAKELYTRTSMSLSDIAELLGRNLKSVHYYLQKYNDDYVATECFRELADKIGGIIDGCGRSPV